MVLRTRLRRSDQHPTAGQRLLLGVPIAGQQVRLDHDESVAPVRIACVRGEAQHKLVRVDVQPILLGGGEVLRARLVPAGERAVIPEAGVDAPQVCRHRFHAVLAGHLEEADLVVVGLRRGLRIKDDLAAFPRRHLNELLHVRVVLVGVGRLVHTPPTLDESSERVLGRSRRNDDEAEARSAVLRVVSDPQRAAWYAQRVFAEQARKRTPHRISSDVGHSDLLGLGVARIRLEERHLIILRGLHASVKRDQDVVLSGQVDFVEASLLHKLLRGDEQGAFRPRMRLEGRGVWLHRSRDEPPAPGDVGAVRDEEDGEVIGRDLQRMLHGREPVEVVQIRVNQAVSVLRHPLGQPRVLFVEVLVVRTALEELHVVVAVFCAGVGVEEDFERLRTGDLNHGQLVSIVFVRVLSLHHDLILELLHCTFRGQVGLGDAEETVRVRGDGLDNVFEEHNAPPFQRCALDDRLHGCLALRDGLERGRVLLHAAEEGLDRPALGVRVVARCQVDGNGQKLRGQEDEVTGQSAGERAHDVAPVATEVDLQLRPRDQEGLLTIAAVQRLPGPVGAEHVPHDIRSRHQVLGIRRRLAEQSGEDVKERALGEGTGELHHARRPGGEGQGGDHPILPVQPGLLVLPLGAVRRAGSRKLLHVNAAPIHVEAKLAGAEVQ
mmetsp:Transcript_14844/g.56167  ORF Transcript_14844/g.56167 Transcript_14844/m.56167 type:complete len:663 (+) Transcript_14844:18752-20740(+)